MTNLTLSADNDLIHRARLIATAQGTSLNDMIRQFLRMLVGQDAGAAVADELLDLMTREPGHSQGRSWSREDAYEGERGL